MLQAYVYPFTAMVLK